MSASLVQCPLCDQPGGSRHFHRDRQRDYYRCAKCRLIHVPPTQFLSPEAERAQYDLHRNSPHDPAYRKFLDRLFVPLNKRLTVACRGLDFGSGPGPTLSLMFAEAGHTMDVYDPFYAPRTDGFSRQYDFITGSEVVEHFHDPVASLSLMWSLLKPGGWLGIMTKLALDREAFARWHYRRDPTHVCFFSIYTMQWLAKQWGASFFQCGKDVILFRKTC